MTDRGKLISESNRGAQARAILENALFQDAFMAINRAIWAQLGRVNVHDGESVQALLALRKANERLYQYFEQHVRTGQMADIQLRPTAGQGD